MKRALALLLTLLLAASVGMGVVAAEAGACRDRVTLTPTVLTGHPEAARGLEIFLPATLEHQLFWDTTVTLTPEPEAETVYRPGLISRQDPLTIPDTGLRLESELGYAYSFGGNEPETVESFPGLDRAYRELLEETPPGTSSEKTIRLADYLEYYPLSMTLDLPGIFLSMDERGFLLSDAVPEDMSADLQVFSCFRDFFRIPVLPDEQVTLGLAREDGGSGESGFLGSGENSDSFGFSARTVAAEDAIYLTFDPHTSQGAVVDTSLIPGGFGIYRLPLDRSQGGQGIRADRLENCFPLDPACRPLDLSLSADGRRLVLHSVEEGTYFVTTVDLATRETVQRISVCPYPGAEPDVWARVIPGDGFVMTLLRDQTLCVLDQSLDGTCRVAFATDLYLPDDFPSFLYETARTAWDGRRLAILIPDIFGQCGFTLAVYTEEGIGYYGTYASSLAGGQPPVELREHLVTVRWTA